MTPEFFSEITPFVIFALGLAAANWTKLTERQDNSRISLSAVKTELDSLALFKEQTDKALMEMRSSASDRELKLARHDERISALERIQKDTAEQLKILPDLKAKVEHITDLLEALLQRRAKDT